jgi:uncharacterized protein
VDEIIEAEEGLVESMNGTKITGGFWQQKQDINREVSLPIAYDHCLRTGRIDALRHTWKNGDPKQPHHYWDSDIAKWVEAAAYSLADHPDPGLEKRVAEVVDLVIASQQPDGYLNSYFMSVEPGNRLKNLYQMHELYCAGHLIEAAVAWFETTGKKDFLDAMCRYADYIGTVFGPGGGQLLGYPGHQEIELALVKLYRATGRTAYLELSRFFLDERGERPSFFDLEATARGEKPLDFTGTWQEVSERHSRFQAHRPVREQATVEGHAVRAMYMLSSMADVAAETGDDRLAGACRTLWDNATQKRMYITGGIGSSNVNERFTFDFDLPNETGYCETCAAVGFVFWARRMLQMDGDSKYADIMERVLYNGALSGVSQSGDLFFYANPLQVYPEAHRTRTLAGIKGHFKPARQPWFDTACCPPNIARLIASVGHYTYSHREGEIYIHLYAHSETKIVSDGQSIGLSQKTDYPWSGMVRVAVEPESDTVFTLAFRVPGWCRDGQMEVTINESENVDTAATRDKGYVKVKRRWHPGDTVDLRMPMPVERMYSHPFVRTNGGKIALQRGPLVYCLEETDNGKELGDVMIPRDSHLEAHFEPEFLGGIVTIQGRAFRTDIRGRKDALYSRVVPRTRETEFKAVPYFAWCNRDPGEMIVWIREC